MTPEGRPRATLPSQAAYPRAPAAQGVGEALAMRRDPSCSNPLRVPDRQPKLAVIALRRALFPAA